MPLEIPKSIKHARQKQRVKQWEMSVISMFGQLLAKKTRTFVIPAPDEDDAVSQTRSACNVLVEQGPRLLSEIKLPVEVQERDGRFVHRNLSNPLRIRLRVPGFRDSTMVLENGSIVVSYEDTNNEELGEKSEVQKKGKTSTSRPVEIPNNQPSLGKRKAVPQAQTQSQVQPQAQIRKPVLDSGTIASPRTNRNSCLPTTGLTAPLPATVPYFSPGILNGGVTEFYPQASSSFMPQQFPPTLLPGMGMVGNPYSYPPAPFPPGNGL